MFRKDSNIHFEPKIRYNMVASRQVENPFYRDNAGHRGREFGALAQVIGRTASPFLRKHIVPLAKRVGADLLEFAVPEFSQVVSGRKKFKTAGKNVARHPLRKQLGSGTRRRTAARINPTKCAEQTNRSRRNISYKHFSTIMSSNFWYRHFVAVSGNFFRRKVPVVDDVLSSHEKQIFT